jgi:hypothetical protein
VAEALNRSGPPRSLEEPEHGERPPERVEPPPERVEEAARELERSPAGAPARRRGPDATPEPPDEDGPRVRSAHHARFAALSLLLGAVAVVAGALAVGLATGRGAGPDRHWSAWHPTRDGAIGAQQIADHVGPQYRLPNKRQLVAVRGGELAIQNIPTKIVLNGGAGGASRIELVEGKSILYSLCGLGPRCSIRSGKASVTRHVLLQREALELALYSFRYLDVDNVVVMMPPPPGDRRSEAMFFRSRDFRPMLDRPLRETLHAASITVDDFPATGEVQAIQRLTAPRDFRFSLIQGQDASLLLVLDPFA